MNNPGCPTNHPLCSTLVFLVGCILGNYFGSASGARHAIIVIGVATTVFHLTQVIQLRLSYKKSK